MKSAENKIVGNLAMTLYQEDGSRVHLVSSVNLSLETQASRYEEVMSALKKTVSTQELKLLLIDKEVLGVFLWEAYNAMVLNNGVATVRQVFPQIAEHAIAAIGPGTYLFDLTDEELRGLVDLGGDEIDEYFQDAIDPQTTIH